MREERVWRALAVGAVAIMGVGLPSCILGEVDLEGRACPCAEGYGCDVATNTCVKGDGTSGPASSAASSTTSGSPTSTADASTADASSASGSGGDGGGGTGGAGGGDGGAGGAPATTTTAGTGGSGGEGGAPGCPDDQTENVPMCSDFFDTFDDPVAFADNYSFTGPTSAFVVEDSRLTITMSTQAALLAIPTAFFDMIECGITVRLLTAPTGADVIGRFSIAPAGQQSRFSIGVVEETLQVREGDNVVAAIDYDPDVHRYLRIREEGGSLYFATSADGICWDERHDVESTDTIGLSARLALVADAAATDSVVEYDDYNVLP